MTSDTPGGLMARLRRRRSQPRSRVRRRLGTVVRLTLALTLAGGVYAVFAPGLSADDTPQLSTAAEEGKALFDQSCITCHGRNAQGVQDRGPSLIGVGAAAVEFQVSTGRMPMARQEAQAPRKPSMFTDDQTRQLAQYIQELGGGPQVPDGDLRAPSDDDEAIARGGNLFRINCSSCHAFGGGGGALSSGKYAPSLDKATDRQMYAAMLTGPQNMPVFGDNQLTPEQKKEIISYVQESLKQDKDPGGWGLGRFGPVTEGLAIFLVGIVALVFAALWIAGKS
ncbi:cytochrome bc1 complex diheme cytochrome c subunit [Phytohabitans houttuyneae]|uniref:Cytochrome bc1 complex cytochrome c subunit n=1 Tax=Phytohabitans houttuyneae TaxID=1076126 RepID=A0A6V8KTR8_9ACTN|nr:cytochrome c [Phytohabitans houttuyneae]GFJ85709.1 putative ubiquinol-cytochrome c reductase cytochrome c subunit [Phytohabitans houttuyneae]